MRWNKTLKSKQDVQEMVDEWTILIENILSTIVNSNYKEENKEDKLNLSNSIMNFWDQDSLENSSELVIKFIIVFLYSQNLKSEKELNELQEWFDCMSSWIVKAMQWSNLSQSELDDIFASFVKFCSINSQESIDVAFTEAKTIIENESGSYKIKYIIVHFALFLTSTINKNGDISISHYNPGYREFLFNMINSIFYHERSK